MIHITTAGEWTGVNDALSGFTDGVVRHFRLDTGDFVTTDLSAALEGRIVASALIQFQSRSVPAAHLLFGDVLAASVDRRRDEYPAVAEASQEGRWRVRFLSLEIEAAECWVTLLPSAFTGAV